MCAFRAVIRKTGKAIVLFGDWQSPVVLSRCWCVFEIWAMLQEGADVEVLLTRGARNNLTAVLRDGAVEMVERSLRVTPLHEGRVRREADRQRILAVVNGNLTPMEADELHLQVEEMLRQWIASIGLEIVVQRGLEEASLRLMSAVARTLRGDAEQLPTACRLLQAVVGRLEASQGKQEPHEQQGPQRAQGPNAGTQLSPPQESPGSSASHQGSGEMLLRSLSDLGTVLRLQGRYPEAESLLRRSLYGRESVLGPRDPATLSSVQDLALLLQDKGDLEEAIHLALRCMTGREAVLGPEHPRTLATTHLLAHLLVRYDSCAAAEPLLRRCLANSRATRGLRHPDTLVLSRQLGSVMRHLEQKRRPVRPDGDRSCELRL